MEKNNVIGLKSRDLNEDPLTTLLRNGAQKLIQQAIEVELQLLMNEHAERRTNEGHAGVARNGYLPERELQTGIGPVTIKVPEVRAKSGEPVTFNSALVPPYVRKTQTLEAAIPWLYLKGISSGEMAGALSVLLGSKAQGFSANTVSRLKQVWASEYKDWKKKSLSADQWVYV